jgi:hypothetical protein
MRGLSRLVFIVAAQPEDLLTALVAPPRRPVKYVTCARVLEPAMGYYGLPQAVEQNARACGTDLAGTSPRDPA